jgi:sec-independent protein translocase protein TatA
MEFQPWHIVVVAIVALLLFGTWRLPEMGKGLGEALRGFKEGIKGVSDPPAPTPQQNTASTPTSSAPIEPK